MSPATQIEERIAELSAKLDTYTPVENALGIDLERPVKSLRDGYPENSVALAGQIVEAILKHVWTVKGVSGEPSRKTLHDLLNGCKDYLRDRTIFDHITIIQNTRNRASHHGGVVVNEDALDTLRRLATVLDWFTASFGPVVSDTDGVLDALLRDRLEFTVGLYRVQGYEVAERFSFSSQSAYLLMQYQQGITTRYTELILSENLEELSTLASANSEGLFRTNYPTTSRLVALGRGRWQDHDLPEVLRGEKVLTFDELPKQFLDYGAYRRAATASGATRGHQEDLPASGQLLSLNKATHEFSIKSTEDAQTLLRDLFLADRGNVLVIGRPGAGKSEQLRRLFDAASQDDSQRIVFHFDLAEKPAQQAVEEYLSASLAQYFTVPPHVVFPLYAYLSRSGRVRNIFDGIDEACATGSFADFLQIFAAISELISVESQVVMSSRIAFLEDSPYVRQLLNRDALISQRVADEVTSVGIDPLRLPKFSVLKLTDVPICLPSMKRTSNQVIGSPLEHTMLKKIPWHEAQEQLRQPSSSRSTAIVSSYVEQCVMGNTVTLDRLTQFFGGAFLRGREKFTLLELYNEFGAGLFPNSLEPHLTSLPGLLRPLGEDKVRFQHRVLQEYLAALYLLTHMNEISEPVYLTEQVRAFFSNLASLDQQDDCVVRAGTYVVGSGDSLRLHRVAYPYRVQRYPVTNREYRDFLAAAEAGEIRHFEHRLQPADLGHRPAEWRMLDPNRLGDPQYAKHPVTCINWWSAYAYARWRGGRLLDSVEWECAARGADGRIFPWGDEVEVGRVNAADYWAGTKLVGYNDWKEAVDSGALRKAGTTAVDWFSGNRSPSGARDMVGNVWEWTATVDPSRGRAVICGGSYDNPFRGVRTYSKGVYGLTEVSNVVGFRWGEDL